VLGLEDAHELFAWLRQLSFVESGLEGVFPHDLARDALEADLRWRDPDGYRRVYRGVRAHIHGRLQASEGHEQQRAIFDAKFLFRRLPGILSPVDWDTWGHHYPEPARPEDREPILDLTRAWEGEESAAIAARWWKRQPEGFFVVRGQDGAVGGFLVLLDLTPASTQDIAADPGTRAAWDYAKRQAAPRPSEAVTQSRFIIDREAYQGPSPTLNATPILTFQRYRRVPMDALLELVTERALSQDLTPSPLTVKPSVLVLSQPEFDQAARQALRGPDLLARNPLLRTRMVRDRAGTEEPGAATLEAVVCAAVESLCEHPRDDKLWRAVERTYVRPAATQERAAAALGLPFSTYRRHLTQGVDRVVAWLWDQEVYGSEHH
jgi:hypothetical protein